MPKRSREAPKRVPRLPKGRPKPSKIVLKTCRFSDHIFDTHFVICLINFETPRTSKIVLPCARELNFQKIVLLAVDTDF